MAQIQMSFVLFRSRAQSCANSAPCQKMRFVIWFSCNGERLASWQACPTITSYRHGTSATGYGTTGQVIKLQYRHLYLKCRMNIAGNQIQDCSVSYLLLNSVEAYHKKPQNWKACKWHILKCSIVYSFKNKYTQSVFYDLFAHRRT